MLRAFIQDHKMNYTEGKFHKITKVAFLHVSTLFACRWFAEVINN